MKYVPNIDGLRAIAVFGVLVSHYLPSDNFLKKLPWGLLGVYLFFIISGYLITTILIKIKNKYNGQIKKGLMEFYAKRFLRIFPPYYLLLFLYIFAGIDFKWSDITSCFFYYFNIYQSIYPSGEYKFLGHFWTLCIEEQFYLCWPIVVYLCNSRLLLKLTLILILVSPVTRFILSMNGLDFIQIRNLPICALDYLGLGALLAQFHLGQWKTAYKVLKKYKIWILLISGSLYLIGHQNILGSEFDASFGLFFSGVTGFVVLEYASQSNRKFVNVMLGNRIIRYVGRISYGIYLYQFLSLLFLYKLISIVGNPPVFQNEWGFAGIWTLMTMIICISSWHLYESPLLKLKKRFE